MERRTSLYWKRRSLAVAAADGSWPERPPLQLSTVFSTVVSAAGAAAETPLLLRRLIARMHGLQLCRARPQACSSGLGNA